MNLNQKDLEKIIVIGDRLLIKPNSLDKTTKTGLILPPGI
jgi:co-chaperonin GroES (HSP10)